jgi:ankyrin repeat protein
MRTIPFYFLLVIFSNLNCFSQNLNEGLINAIEKGNLDSVKYYVEKGVDVNLTDDRNFNAFTFAIRGTNPAIVYYLKDKGAKIFPDKKFPLICNSLSYSTNPDVFRAALETGVSIMENTDYGLNIFFMFWQNMKNSSIFSYPYFRVLINHIAVRNPNMVDTMGFTPLMRIASFPDFNNFNPDSLDAYLITLIQAGASINLKNYNGKTAFDLLPNPNTLYNDLAMRIFIKNGAISSTGKKGIAEKLLSGVVQSKLDIDGQTSNVLMEYCNQPDTTFIRYLLEYGAKIDYQDPVTKLTPLIIAAKARQKSMCDYLLDNGATINIKGRDGLTPILMASMEKDTSMIYYLISKNADTKAMDASGRTLLHMATYSNSTAMIELALKHITDINTKDNNGNTPLITAVLNGKMESVKALIAGDADILIEDKNGNNALKLAKKSGQKEIAEFLKTCYKK